MLMVLTRQAVEGQRLVDILFDPAGKLRILRRPFGEPSGEIAAIPRVRLRRPEDKLQASAAPAGSHRRPGAARSRARFLRNARNNADRPPPPEPRAMPL